MTPLIHTLFNGFNIASLFIGLGLLLYSWKGKFAFHNRWMQIWLLAAMLHQVFFFLNINALLPSTHPFHLIGYPLAAFHLPVLYFNILALTREQSVTLRLALLHFIPYFLCIGYLLYLHFFSLPPVVDQGFLRLPKGIMNFLGIANGLPMAASGVIYVPLCFIALRNYRKSLKEHYAKLSGIDLQWISHLAWFTAFFFISIFVVIFFSTDYQLFALSYVFPLVSILLSIFIAYYGFRYQQQIERFFHQQIAHLQVKPKKYHKSVLQASEMEEIRKKINRALTENHLYLDEELTLQKLANHLQESPQKISETLNRLMESTFYECVNAHRIMRAKKMLKDEQYATLSIEGIAFDCGFKSKSTFFKLFKKATGLTPNQYKKQ